MILSLSDFRFRRPSNPDEIHAAGILRAQRPAFPDSALKRRLGALAEGIGLGRIFLLGSLAVLLGGCAGFMPSGGPAASSVRNVHTRDTGIQIVDVTDSVASRLLDRHQPESFPEAFRGESGPRTTVEPGDVLEVMIMEAPPASLFGNGTYGSPGGSVGAQAVTFPDQYISSAGIIYLPFAGQVQAAGRTIQQIEDDITAKMKAKANQPQVLVRLVGNNTNYVTVMGAVPSSTHLPLTAARERLLDAIVKAGLTGAEAHTFTIRVTRGARSVTVPLETILRDQSQNIVLQGGDVITVMHQPYNFTVMGATRGNREVPFEGPYITLAQALARAGGLNDTQANIRGVFVFRFESPDAVDWPIEPVMRTPGGRVRVVYCLDLSKPASFFAAKTFPVCDGDVIYAAHAPGEGLQKVLSLVGSISSPVFTGVYEGAATSNDVTP
jgi:polysaccharide export outer membrane protein